MKKKRDSLKEAMKACGITPRGRKLAAAIWAATDQIFAVVPDADPFDVADVVARMFACKASDIQIENAQKGIKRY